MAHTGRVEDSRKRNMERRRETSRFAARDRRAKESDIYDDLKDVVPVVEEPTVTHVDRIALLRVAATVCRFRKNAGNALTMAPLSTELLNNSAEREKQGSSPWSEETLAECLDGFIIIVDSDGVVLYVTESVSIFLGLTQTDFAGRHLKDFCHPDDYKEYMTMVQEMAANKELEDSRLSVIRIKSVISPRGRNLNLKSALLKPVSFTVRVIASSAGHCTLLQGVSIPAGQGTVSSTANAITKGGDCPSGTFMTRHTCDMRISYVSDALNGLLKADSRSLMGASFYDLVYPADVDSLRKCIGELLEKGHTRTPYYRLLTSSGALAWVLTEGTTISHTTRGQKGQYIICIHHMLGQQTEKECDEGAREGLAAGMEVKIKQEPEDRELAEYLGRQPEVMECVDFCPLIGDVDMGDYTPVAARRPRGGSFGAAQENTATRKKSYEEVLQWLFRDQPECPAPERTNNGPAGGRSGTWGSSAAAAHGYGPRGQSIHPSLQTGASAHSAAQFAAAARGGKVGGPQRGARMEGGRGGGHGGHAAGAEGGYHGGYADDVFVSGMHGPMHGRTLQQPAAARPGAGGQTPSPQNLSSCFSRACDLSSPQGGVTASPTSPLSASPVDCSLRANDVHYAAAESRRLSGFSPSGAVPLSGGGVRGGMRCDGYIGGQARADMLAAVPSARLPSSPLLQSARFNGGSSHGGASRSSSATSKADGNGHFIESGLNGSLSSATACGGGVGLGLDDSSDLSCYAPFIDPGMDMQPLGAGLPKELASLLDLPPWADSDGLADPLADIPLYPPRDSPPSKRMYNESATGFGAPADFDDWPRWLEN